MTSSVNLAHSSPVQGENEQVEDGGRGGRVVDGEVGQAHAQPELPA